MKMKLIFSLLTIFSNYVSCADDIEPTSFSSRYVFSPNTQDTVVNISVASPIATLSVAENRRPVDVVTVDGRVTSTEFPNVTSVATSPNTEMRVVHIISNDICKVSTIVCFVSIISSAIGYIIGAYTSKNCTT